MRFPIALLLLLGPLPLGAGCQASGVETTGTARPSPSAPASGLPKPSATAAPRDVPTALATALPTSSAATVAGGPEISARKSPPKLQGFVVYDSDGLTVSFKSYYVDNVDRRKEAPYPGCPSEDVITRQKGTIESLEGPEHPILFQVGDRYGAMTSGSHDVKGEYGEQVECCIAGDDVAASSMRPTLTREEAVRSLRICQRLMAPGSH